METYHALEETAKAGLAIGLSNVELIIIAISGLALLGLVAWFFSTPREGMKMRDSAIAANLVWNAFEEAHYRGEITKKYRDYWVRRIGEKAEIPDLLPAPSRLFKKLHPYRVNKLKEDIKYRLLREFGLKYVGRKKVEKAKEKPEPPDLKTKEADKTTFKNFFNKAA